MANSKLSKYLDFFLYVFLAIGVIVFITRQLSKSEVKSFDTYPKTEIQFKFDTLINFGQVKPLKTIEFKGFIKNIGQNKLYIGNLKTSCGCTNFSVANSVVNARIAQQFRLVSKQLNKVMTL
ncbi:MAG: DUF1573 domain-containing protein [Saprospiraceae bacterium]|nr:DUF1573 domain-containing protein [Saprospiraceae bacterium]